jgi:uncharacterized membrane protein YphA (DoxX/SURF4 family)
LSAPFLIRSCRVIVGLVLLVAALGKIGDPATLATQVGHFHLVPDSSRNLIALALPWIELMAGLALVVNVRARSGAWLALALMITFTLAVAQAMARHLNVECGCFGSADATRVGVKKLLENLALTAAAMVGVRRM